METNLSRREIKQRAKAQLRQNGVWGQMMIANLLPWLITVAFALLTLWGVVKLMTAFGLTRIAADPGSFATYYANHGDSESGLLKQLILLWFSQGIAFTALDVYRGAIDRVRPGQAVMRLFNAKYFFGILAVAIWVELLQFIGILAFVIPGILVLFGMSMSFYAYYDGKEHAENGRYGAFTALGQSWRIMNGNKLDYFVLQLSLIGWYLLEAVTWHLFDFMIDPYLQLVDAGFYDNAKRQFEQSQPAA